MTIVQQHAVLIAGPTASGKSAVALRLAEALAGAGGAVIINADSMQLYRELAVLTARPTQVEMDRVPHRLYGIRHAWEPCSAGQWAELAAAEIRASWQGGRIPILVGGTGLYFRALTEGLAEVPDIDPQVRQAARQHMAQIGPAAFHAALAARDPQTAAGLRPTDPQRLLRAWEVLVQTGRPLAAWQQEPVRAPFAEQEVKFIPIALMPARQDIYRRCDLRFDAMIATGALDEVAALDELARVRGLPDSLPLLRAVGVPHLRAYLRGELDRATAVEKAKTATRRYAKRQMTWIRHQMIAWNIIDAQDSESLYSEIFSIIVNSGLTGQD